MGDTITWGCDAPNRARNCVDGAGVAFTLGSDAGQLAAGRRVLFGVAAADRLLADRPP